jgi:PTH1 family peptidyl-tRNA hydrolase
VGKPDTPGFDIADWVLSRMTRSELERLHPALEKAGKAVEEIIRSGVPAAMEIFNRAE